jgi:hypothetical protein
MAVITLALRIKSTMFPNASKNPNVTKYVLSVSPDASELTPMVADKEKVIAFDPFGP